jgi:hypothetical protein
MLGVRTAFKSLGIRRIGPLLSRDLTWRERATDLPSLIADAIYRAVERSASPDS